MRLVMEVLKKKKDLHITKVKQTTKLQQNNPKLLLVERQNYFLVKCQILGKRFYSVGHYRNDIV